MALDPGDRRIGIAITDAIGMTVQARPTRTRTTLAEDIAHIRTLVEDNDVERLVVGHPRHMDGKASRQTRKTEVFVEQLKAGVAVPIVLWDERLTSFEAEQRLEEMGMDWRKRKKHVDELAAILILEDFLGSRKEAGRKA